ncbi:molybdenum cofactor biosynthesis protein B [Pasteurella atlantica]|uniref:Molybdenum cofactor biosynthesis protein B n=2 Tax=Pasteurellaceae TaxID=712 RepID=A0ACC6HMI2_9PAST|nr:molybdenum cofactor biosynthesis protein B [Pasteurella atlantica]MDP8052044.1 molybdenum cofactor biosynthesis protein B [Pasteurella atlantica]MDP8105559.1 molybdenum cofactor biosynthesis protein B [Pasteurella atlantica]MDP8148915.1 molybdenum cofactor biosynthesis protein B [Pasteurella atlantica]
MHDGGKQFEPLNIAILTVSDTRTFAEDTSGDYLQESLLKAGHNLYERKLCTDHLYDIRAIVSQWIADKECQVVIITGGTGFYDKDITPEAVTILFDKTVDGFGEVFRQCSQNTVQLSTIQSRAVAGVANRTLIFAIPGSTGACKTAWGDILENQLDARTKPCNFVPHVRFIK